MARSLQFFLNTGIRTPTSKALVKSAVGGGFSNIYTNLIVNGHYRQGGEQHGRQDKQILSDNSRNARDAGDLACRS